MTSSYKRRILLMDTINAFFIDGSKLNKLKTDVKLLYFSIRFFFLHDFCVIEKIGFGKIGYKTWTQPISSKIE